MRVNSSLVIYFILRVSYQLNPQTYPQIDGFSSANLTPKNEFKIISEFIASEEFLDKVELPAESVTVNTAKNDVHLAQQIL